MKGQVLDYSVYTDQGIITATDGARYNFTASEWKVDGPPLRGTWVDFETQGTDATAIYRALTGYGYTTHPSPKNKIAAGLLAIFLGGLGIHKFYLGYTGPGLIYLLTNTIGWIFTIFLLGIPNLILGIIALTEGIIYLTKSDDEFEQTYVLRRKSWL